MILGPAHLIGFLGLLVFWGGVIVLIIWAVRYFASRPTVLPPAPPAPPTPRQILDERLARGETTVEEYEKARAALDKNS
jgi:putative membrane protein